MTTFLIFWGALIITATPVLGGIGLERYLTDFLKQDVVARIVQITIVSIIFILFCIYRLLVDYHRTVKLFTIAYTAICWN